jgi:hypothetical protein
MRKHLLFGAGVLAAGCLAWGIGPRPVQSAPVPEHTLAGIRLGRTYLDVLRLYGGPNEVQTVAVPTPGAEGAPGEGGPGAMPGGMPGGFPGSGGGFPGGSGGGFPGMRGSGGPMMGGMSGGMRGGGSMYGGGMSGGMRGSGGPMGGMGGMSGGMRGGGKFGGMMGGAGQEGNSPFSSPTGGGFGSLPPAGGFGGMMGGAEAGGAGGPETPNGPEYSSALMWIYHKPNNVRLEFLINEDGRVAQISVAAPIKNATTTVPSVRGPVAVKTSRGIRLGSGYATVVSRYGFPERTRKIPGGRFDESYYTRNYHCAFTGDDLSGNRVVRITITLAD